MPTTLRRQLSDSEKQQILSQHRRECFVTGHAIPEGQSIQFDHIRAFAIGGATELDNIAPMCDTHNQQKGTLPLLDFRVKLRLQEFFEGGDTLTLKDLLEFLKKQGDIKSYGSPIISSTGDGVLLFDTPVGRREHVVHKCQITGWHYFYATLPVAVLDSDDTTDERVGLQPRYLIFDKVFDLYRHFQRHPVLQPSIGRLSGDRVLLFDGQHKIAGMLWGGRREFECKIYLDPDLRLLNETNIAAHDTFSQTRFFSSIMVMKLGAEFGADFDAYRKLEDGSTKSEAGFVRFLEQDPTRGFTRAQVSRRFRSYLYNLVLQHDHNRAAQYVSNVNRSTDEKPLTIDLLSKSIFANFLYASPAEESMASEAYKREQEIEHVVELMNMLHDQALGSWNAKAGANDFNQRRLTRLFRSKSAMAWSELLRDAVCAKLDLIDQEDRARPLYRDLTPESMERIKRIVERLVGWKMWNSPANAEIDRILADNKTAVKEWLKANGLTTGYLLGAAA